MMMVKVAMTRNMDMLNEHDACGLRAYALLLDVSHEMKGQSALTSMRLSTRALVECGTTNSERTTLTVMTMTGRR